MNKKKRPELGSIKELRFALSTAKKAHGDQIRVIGPDAGLLYFDTHVVRVVQALPPWAKPAGALHDVLEDCGACFWGVQIWQDVSEETLAAVELLTRDPKVPYGTYINDICAAEGLAGRIARVVKFTDLMDNLGTFPEGGKREAYIGALGCVAGAIHHNDEGSWDLE